MNDNAKTWVEALRSGKYKQGTGQLRYEEEFCCLGVACDLYDASRWETDKDGELTFMDEMSVLPIKVMDWLGLEYDDGAFNGDDNSLVTMNDRGKTFNDIADIIESEPQGLFV